MLMTAYQWGVGYRAAASYQLYSNRVYVEVMVSYLAKRNTADQ
jgi:hypothetical protein